MVGTGLGTLSHTDCVALQAESTGRHVYSPAIPGTRDPTADETQLNINRRGLSRQSFRPRSFIFKGEQGRWKRVVTLVIGGVMSV